MVNKKLIDDIEKRLADGEPIDLIKEELIAKGLPAQEIENTIASLYDGKPSYAKRMSVSVTDTLIKKTDDTPLIKRITYDISERKLFYTGVISALVVIGMLTLFFLSLISITISDNELTQGTFVDFNKNKEAKFILNEEEHKIVVDSVYEDSISIIIQSEPIKTSLKIGEEKKFDLDSDGEYDIIVILNNIENGIANIYIKKIEKVRCIADWNCSEWSNCSNAIQTKTCADLNNCRTTEEKPDETRDCIMDLEILKNETANNTQAINNTKKANYSLELGINISKDLYEIGESVKGDYIMSYNGDSFEGIVLYTFSREDCSEKYYAKARGIIETGSFSDGKLSVFKTAFKAFKYNKVGNSCSYVAGTDFFYEEGNYTYTIAVYNCSYIKEMLNKTCSNATFNEITQITPVKSASKSIIVKGGNYTSECKTNDNCAKLCEQCKIGKQLCRLPSEICSECATNFNCKEGYKCIEYKCVINTEANINTS